MQFLLNTCFSCFDTPFLIKLHGTPQQTQVSLASKDRTKHGKYSMDMVEVHFKILD